METNEVTTAINGDCKITHLSVSVEGLLKLKDSQLGRLCTNDDGSRMTGKQARADLLDRQRRGEKVIKTGDCDNFSIVDGCLGHPCKTE